MSSIIPEKMHSSLLWPKRLVAFSKRIPSWEKLYTRSNRVIIDAVIIAVSLILAFWLRFEGGIPGSEKDKLLFLLPYIVLLRITINYWWGVYLLVWRYVSISDIPLLLKPMAACSAIFLSLRLFLPGDHAAWKLPLSIIAIEFLLVLTGTLGIRVLRRILYEKLEASGAQTEGAQEKRVLLVGAGIGGVMVVKEIERKRETRLKIMGFVDDDPTKVNTMIAGVKVLGTTVQLEALVRRLGIEEVIITIASASRKDIRRIVSLCEAIPVTAKIIPGLYEILGGRVRISKFREVRVEDLLGRDVVEFNNGTPEVRARFSGRRILVTGAGGSIGSELCRQIQGLDPQQLILVEKDENSLFEIDLELKSLARCRVIPVIADIRDRRRLESIFERERPQVIFHAAAHKHVPLMELNPSEAILNNVVGTNHLVDLADRYGVDAFVMLSTDKAVNPANVMGASKRLAETLVQAKAVMSQTRFSCVRFGNVLGSRGSVIPVFQKQIAEGGPVTVTHPEATRYFMTIPEAAHLVIQAGSLGNNGEIFVLDMGEPVRILDVAKDLISLSGLKLGEDMDIESVGLRPGEKLHEEPLIQEGRTKATKFKKIFMESPMKVEAQKLEETIRELEQAARLNDQEKIQAILEAWFNGYLKRAGSAERFLRNERKVRVSAKAE